VLGSAEKKMDKRYKLQSGGFDVERVASRVSEVLGVNAKPDGD